MTEPVVRRPRRRGLSDKQIAALPRKARRYIIADPVQRGMYVRVPPQGPAVFCAVARSPMKRQIWATIGSADVMGVEQARGRAREAIRRIREGLPAFEPVPVSPDAFKSVAESWLVRHVQANKLRSRGDIERCLERYVYPHWKDRPFTGLRRGDVSALLDKIEDDHGPRQADVCLGIIRALAHWYQARNDDYVSPVVRGMQRYKQADHKRKRILGDDEIRALWACCNEIGVFGSITKILLLTAQRRAKVATMRWDDLIDGEWRIATEHREKSNAGTLRLPQVALDIIRAQPRLAGNPFVFAATIGKGPFGSFTQRKGELDQRLRERLPNTPPWVVHDLRRTARSLMSRAGVRPDISERVLGHTIGGVEGVYDRHRYDDEKAEALQRLAGLIERIVNAN